MDTIKCPTCGHQVGEHVKTCPDCGIKIAGNAATSLQHGGGVHKGSRECHACDNSSLAGEDCDATADATASLRADAAGQSPTNAGGQGGKPRHRRKCHTLSTVVAVSIVFAMLIVFTFMYVYKNKVEQNELDAYAIAMESGERAVLRNYLDIYVDAPARHRETVAARIESMERAAAEWGNAVASGSRTALELYMQQHPGSIHGTEAKIMIDSLDWMEATVTGTLESYRAYMERHPNGQYVDDAQAKFERLDALRMAHKDSVQ